MTRHSVQDDEHLLVEELRQRLKDLLDSKMYEDTSMFIRFLKARNYDLKAAENMLRNHHNWRKIRKVENFVSWYTPHEVSEKYIPLRSMGFDKDGTPVSYFDFGNLDLRGLLKSIKPTEIENFLIRHLEGDVRKLREETEKRKKKIDKWIYLLNFENFSLATATNKQTLEAIAMLVSLYEANYPEMLKGAILFNTSWYFQIAFAVIKPLLTGPTLQKIKIFGKEGWKEELLTQIGADALPAFLGGNRTDPNGDRMCRTFLTHGEPVPELYYAINNENDFSKQPGVNKLVIKRFSKEKIPLTVMYPGSDIEWEFKTKAKDIAFSLFYRDTSSSFEAKEVIPKQRCDTTISSEAGLFKCDNAGTYYLEFDNSYSWMHQKEVYYKVQVRCPQK